MLETRSIFALPAFLLYDDFMYIFGESAQEASVSNCLKDVKPKFFHDPEYYDRAYQHLSSVTWNPFTMDMERMGRNIAATLIGPELATVQNDDFRFIVGQKMAQSLRNTRVMLDEEAVTLLQQEFCDTALLRIRIEGTTYHSWSDFATFDVRKVSAASGIECSVKITYVDKTCVKKRVKGKVKFTEDTWGFHPTGFVPNNFSRNQSLDEVDVSLNKILTDRHLRREMAEEYIAKPDSEIISRSTFQAIMEEILPFVFEGGKYDPAIFNPLCGGRTPADTCLFFRYSSDKNRDILRIRVFRCLKCGVPTGMKAERLHPSDWIVQKEKGAKSSDAVKRASTILAASHGFGACYPRLATVTGSPSSV